MKNNIVVICGTILALAALGAFIVMVLNDINTDRLTTFIATIVGIIGLKIGNDVKAVRDKTNGPLETFMSTTSAHLQSVDESISNINDRLKKAGH